RHLGQSVIVAASQTLGTGPTHGDETHAGSPCWRLAARRQRMTVCRSRTAFEACCDDYRQGRVPAPIPRNASCNCPAVSRRPNATPLALASVPAAASSDEYDVSVQEVSSYSVAS